MTFNTRAIALYISLLIGEPWLYFVFEVVVMTSLFVYMRHCHEMCIRDRDGTVKYLFRTPAHNFIEAVYIPDEDRATPVSYTHLQSSSMVGSEKVLRITSYPTPLISP